METIYNLNKLQERRITTKNNDCFIAIYNGILNEYVFGVTTNTIGFFPVNSKTITLYCEQEAVHFDVVSIASNKLVLRRS
jgi:hypothetical protein